MKMSPLSFVKTTRLSLGAHPPLDLNWLRERVAEDPSVLGLGELELADEGHTGEGWLELLLRDRATELGLTAVVRSGAADESDLLRALEQWTIESARYPEKQHFALLIAEAFPPRVLSAVSVLGAKIPLSAVQIIVLRIGEQVALHFARVVDRLPCRSRREIAQAMPEAVERSSPAATPPAKVFHKSPEPEPEPATPAVAPRASASDNGRDDTREALLTIPRDDDVFQLVAPGPTAETRPTFTLRASPAEPAPARAGQSAPPEAWPARPRPRGQGFVFSLVCVLSLLLCAATIFGWVRSYWVRDVRAVSAGTREFMIYSDRGQIDWITASALESDPTRYVKLPYALLFGLTTLLPFAWLMRHTGKKPEYYR